jgi:hypothetical protein
MAGRLFDGYKRPNRIIRIHNSLVKKHRNRLSMFRQTAY